MGRRPSPIILHFFQRGDKLKDSSNRYEHTCRLCNATLSKGRSDNLLNHILRSCPNASTNDREIVVEHIQQQGHTSLDKNKLVGRQGFGKASAALTPTNYTTSSIGLTQPLDLVRYDAGLPSLAAQREQTALDTLAEVSRRQLDSGGQLSGGLHDLLDHISTNENQSFIDQLREAARSDHGVDSEQFLDRDMDMSTTKDDALVNTASAANRHLESACLNGQPHRGDGVLTSRDDEQPNLNTESEKHLEMTWNPTNMACVNNIATVAASPQDAMHTRGFGILQKPVKNKSARSRFTDDRRKQVSQIRKQGACIRCRMLKKPCSGGTPCQTCDAVSSATLWRASCVRSRLAEEFTLWSTGYFHATAVQSVPAAVHGRTSSRLPGYLEICLVSKTKHLLKCSARQYRTNDVTDAFNEPGNLAVDDIVLVDDGEGFGESIDNHLFSALDFEKVHETNDFIGATLRQAQALLNEGNDDLTSQKEAKQQGTQSSRTCYNFRSFLLRNVLDLWSQTSVLAGGDDNFSIRYVKEQDLAETQDATADNTKQAVMIARTSKSFQLITAQLRAAIEGRCAKLGKVIMNELERRLLQRQQVSRAATLVSALLLLNCVERMSSLYYRLADLQAKHGPNTNWPLDSHPSSLWPQGERFADLLVMLLKMRGLPPQTTVTANGGLEVATDWLPSDEYAKAYSDASENEQRKAVAALQESVPPETAYLLQDIRTGTELARDWDMRFVAKVLLPNDPAR